MAYETRECIAPSLMFVTGKQQRFNVLDATNHGEQCTPTHFLMGVSAGESCYASVSSSRRTLMFYNRFSRLSTSENPR